MAVKKDVKKSEKSHKKEEKEDKTQAEQDKNNLAKVDRQVFWIFGFLVFLVVVFLIAYYFIFPQFNKFTYEGLQFTKTKFGEIPVYHHYFYFKDNTGKMFQYNLYLRIDPRKNNVPVDGEIVMQVSKPTYISINSTDFTQCPYSSVAIANLASFLNDNLVPTKGAVGDRVLAAALNTTYIDCNDSPQNTVILLQSGSETTIKREKDYCYVITVANCEILNAAEKFELQSVADARARKAILNGSISN